MTPKGKTDVPPVTGLFRVNNNVLYQKTAPKSPTMDRVVGTNAPDGKTTRITLTDLRVLGVGHYPDKISNFRFLKGTALLKAERYGEWSGTFIGSKGVNWDMHCTRIENESLQQRL